MKNIQMFFTSFPQGVWEKKEEIKRVFMNNSQDIEENDSRKSSSLEDQFSRTKMLIGEVSEKKIHSQKIAVFGLGGVGSFVVEALTRAGIENFLLVDNDIIMESNLNRQLYALHSTIGSLKTDCAKKRGMDINPAVNIKTMPLFYCKEQQDAVDKELSTCNYIIDAIDTVSAKLLLIERAKYYNIPIISCMGTGNKLNPSRFEIVDIEKTSVCPLAKVMRKELRVRGLKNIKVLFSKEEPTNNRPPASISFVPSSAGLLIASEVIKDIVEST